MEGKPFYLSKTLWANVISFVALQLGGQFGVEFSEGEVGAFFLVLNSILRAVTKGAVTLS